ncbi:5-oxoprolinase subunit PxpA [Labrenzia sp. OB1]|uniref:5-oxoprolinase subunit PxpA n=1 Tax=Labrenzia sp. OB1 TaxID=1561204 RepID=UPI0007B27742|nr:5-oxoprolinase subunit PxpA [Labrenzia sp. OB1]KZM51667.1 LamB/YcsF family protein [Labrenzia sp. OB1]
MPVELNCDMGESYGLYKMGDDEGIMPFISQANIACGFHGSDPNHMRRAVELARKFDVKVGAHFSLPDLPGFGRREMKIEREEMVNIIIYQVGAIKGFLEFAGLKLMHLKPHGALYGMAARMEPIAQAVADVAQVFDVPVLGLAGTLHEEVFKARGVGFQAEFFADLDYDDDGRLLITREHKPVDAVQAAKRVQMAVREGMVASINGKPVPVRAETVCVHSDTPDAVGIAKAVQGAIAEIEAA